MKRKKNERLVGGPIPGTIVVDEKHWPLNETFPTPFDNYGYHGRYVKVSESKLDLETIAKSSHIMRGVEYKWEED